MQANNNPNQTADPTVQATNQIADPTVQATNQTADPTAQANNLIAAPAPLANNLIAAPAPQATNQTADLPTLTNDQTADPTLLFNGPEMTNYLDAAFDGEELGLSSDAIADLMSSPDLIGTPQAQTGQTIPAMQTIQAITKAQAITTAQAIPTVLVEQSSQACSPMAEATFREIDEMVNGIGREEATEKSKNDVAAREILRLHGVVSHLIHQKAAHDMKMQAIQSKLKRPVCFINDLL